jgi:hypothetical protein
MIRAEKKRKLAYREIETFYYNFIKPMYCH